MYEKLQGKKQFSAVVVKNLVTSLEIVKAKTTTRLRQSRKMKWRTNDFKTKIITISCIGMLTVALATT